MLKNLSLATKNSTFTFCRSYVRRGGNPGLNKQLKKLDLDEVALEDPEGIGDSESDFMQVHKAHRMYEEETRQHKDKIKLWITKNKYFKEKKPNFLTWTEKEQIRLLYAQDSEEWAAERLSESFPADIETIQKIIKSKWTPKSAEHIERHDYSVMRNWQDFREGKFTQLNVDLENHLKKFSVRRMEDLKNIKIDWIVKEELPKPKVKMFSDLITSCKKYRDDVRQIEDSEAKVVDVNPFKLPRPDNEDTFLMDKSVVKRPMRFRDLKEAGQIQSDEDKPDESNYDSSPFTVNELKVKKFETTEIQTKQEEIKEAPTSYIRESIKIPRKLWKKGATYKLDDCFYDDDGEFLYRVPGMTGRKV